MRGKVYVAILRQFGAGGHLPAGGKIQRLFTFARRHESENLPGLVTRGGQTWNSQVWNSLPVDAASFYFILASTTGRFFLVKSNSEGFWFEPFLNELLLPSLEKMSNFVRPP